MTQGWLAERRTAVVGTALAVWAAGLAAFLTLVVAYDLDFVGPVGGPWVLGFGAFAITGALITWQRPDHIMGPLFLVLGVITPVANTLAAAAMGPFADHSMALRTLFAAASVAGTTALFPLFTLTIVIFPDGRLPSPRWRWIWAATAAAAAVGAVAAFLTGAWGGDQNQVLITAPFDGRLSDIGRVLSQVYFAMIPGLVLSSGIAIVLRYRRGDATTRQQVRWLAFVACLLAVLAGVMILVQSALQAPAATPLVVLFATTVALVPVSVTIAILRHRLYDIDLVLNRTIVFGALAVFITGLYVVVVVGVGTLIGDPSNVALTVGTTALVAAAFEPVRARVQHWANVAIYGRRATPYEVLAAIAADMGSAGGGDGQLEGMAALLADGTGAEHATVWVNVDDGLRATACWPSHDPAEHPALVVAGGDLELPSGAAHIEPVRHDGELLGALSLDRRREDPVTPREQRLVAELAGQASLVLGNARLRARLRARLEELRASRQRLVATQDEARRRLERDLHDGAQQQLVALKVKLGMARTIAEKEGAGEAVTRRLEQLSATADRAVDSLRSLARGIYPPLLEAEGLERAITAQASSAPIDVVVRADGVGRYSRQVEATIYFCVLEALSNTVEHADASSVEIVLEDLGDRLSFRMADDGRGFDPGTTPRGLGLRNMADRIDALGGEFRVEAAPGAGIRLHGTIPDPKRATDATEPVASMA